MEPDSCRQRRVAAAIQARRWYLAFRTWPPAGHQFLEHHRRRHRFRTSIRLPQPENATRYFIFPCLVQRSHDVSKLRQG